jgi:epsilon-lactone hydrolase
VSWRARCVTLAIEVAMRRVRWDEPHLLASRARRLCATPNPLGWLRTRGVSIEPVQDGAVRGEWLSAGPPGRGVIFYLHGGGYVAGSPVTHRPITAALARLSRRRVFALDYRLAPEHRFPAAVDDALAGYRWLLEQGIAPEALTLVGDSAGDGLVLASLVRARAEVLPLPATAICFSPWTDLTATGDSLRTSNARCALRPENVAALARLYLGGASARHPYASPLFADLEGLPPLLVQVGADEILLDDARRVHDRILAAGGSSTLQVFPGVFHAWHLLDGFVPEAREALDNAATFIDHAVPTAPDRF